MPLRRVLLTSLLTLSALLAGCEWLEDVAPERAPHEQYAEALREAGLGATALGRQWTEAAEAALRRPDVTDLPLEPQPAFAADEPSAWGARLAVWQGEVLHIEVVPTSADSAQVFVDLFVAADSTAGERITGAATYGDTLRLEHRATANRAVILRIQPELLVDVAVGLRIETAPSLAFPVQGADEQAIHSVWGDPRDGGIRSHEGVDIFAARGTPVLAAAPGRIGRVRDTRIGGRVVWLRADDAPVRLYYAHLDSQLVHSGQRVEVGDTLGLVGNTGNARATPPHLHFGVYGRGGAVDPYPFLVGRRGGERTQQMVAGR